MSKAAFGILCLGLTAAVAGGVGYLRRPARMARQEDPAQSEERFRLKPVDEPEMPTSAEEAKKAGYLPLKGGGYLFERKDGSEGVAIPGTILMNRGAIELFACGIGGKEHESVVRIECDIHSLDSALTLCGFKRGVLPKKLNDAKEPQGDRLIVLVQWKDRQEKVVTYRAEDLILHVKRESPMPRVGWTFVGSWVEVEEPSSTPRDRKRYKVLAAAATKSLMTTWRDSTTLLDNPMPDATDDTLYAVNFAVAPPPGTPVVVIIRPPDARDRAEIAKWEVELTK